jgi:tRNA A-37 threonylcarbamoyl transferase component Bud32/tetratricopeptide (TPR) repeat protein
MVGRRIGQYEIVARLGGGGMGVVYKARDGRLSRTVALKFLPQQWSDDESAKQRFVREAQAASATDHPNICTIHDIGSADDGRLFIVMAYYEGQTLKQRLESGPLPLDESLDIATQVAEGLAKAHAQGVVHRDIKPANLILTDDGVRIVDFGLAKFADTLQLTVVGSTLGTAAYMSPEQVKGQETDARSDVWSLGVVLYEMLAGHPPFRGAYAEAISYAIRTDAPAPLREARPEVPEDVEQVVFRALHKDPAVRYQGGRDLARALRQVRGLTVPLDLRTQVVQVPSTAAVRDRRRGVWRWLAVAAALALAIAGGGWWVLLTPVTRHPVLVVPIANETGFKVIEPYRRALTHALLQQLAGSPNIRVVPWPRMLQTIRGVTERGDDMSDNTAMSDLVAATGTTTVIVPTLLYEERRWRVRVDVMDGTPLVRRASYESDAVSSALPAVTAFALTRAAGGLILENVANTWWSRLRPFQEFTPPRGVDTALHFERGIDWMEEQEYASALASFQEAAKLDPQSPILHAWVSRAARIMRRDALAAEEGRRAEELLDDETPSLQRRFVAAIAAEARGDYEAAHDSLESLVSRFPDDATWLGELAALEERQSQDRTGAEAAIRRYGEVLALDGGLIRPQLELCRLYNRLPDRQNAARRGARALAAYTAVGWTGGQALARFCLVDALRQGTPDDRRQAREHAEAALKMLGPTTPLQYNRPRALYYVGLAAGEQARLNEALTLWGEAITTAAAAGNDVLLPLVHGDRGVAHERLGNGAQAAADYDRSADLYEALGDQRGAARQQLNRAALHIRYGEDIETALRNLENGGGVVQDLGDVNFETLSRMVRGDLYRLVGRFADAERELNQALSVAKKNAADQRIGAVTLARGRLLFDQSDYLAARALVEEVAGGGSGAATEAAILLGRIRTKLGDFAAAGAGLATLRETLEGPGQRQAPAFLLATIGMFELEQEHRAPARAAFRLAASRWTPTFADSSSVEARAYLGLLDALDGRFADGKAALQQALEWARANRRVWLETVCRLHLARVHLLESQPRAALDVLREADETRARSLGTEQALLVHYWRGRAMQAAGESGDAELARARALLEQWLAGMTADVRSMVAARPEIRRVTSDGPIN